MAAKKKPWNAAIPPEELFPALHGGKHVPPPALPDKGAAGAQHAADAEGRNERKAKVSVSTLSRESRDLDRLRG